jgi:hypothetical protein
MYVDSTVIKLGNADSCKIYLHIVHQLPKSMYCAYGFLSPPLYTKAARFCAATQELSRSVEKVMVGK